MTLALVLGWQMAAANTARDCPYVKCINLHQLRLDPASPIDRKLALPLMESRCSSGEAAIVVRGCGQRHQPLLLHQLLPIDLSRRSPRASYAFVTSDVVADRRVWTLAAK